MALCITQRKGERDRCPLSFHAVQLNGATMLLDDGARSGERERCAGCHPCGGGSKIGREDAVYFVGGNADAVILYHDHGVVSTRTRLHGYRTPGGTVLHGVAHDVFHPPGE